VPVLQDILNWQPHTIVKSLLTNSPACHPDAGGICALYCKNSHYYWSVFKSAINTSAIINYSPLINAPHAHLSRRPNRLCRSCRFLPFLPPTAGNAQAMHKGGESGVKGRRKPSNCVQMPFCLRTHAVRWRPRKRKSNRALPCCRP
jgi:hypothetical protein